MRHLVRAVPENAAARAHYRSRRSTVRARAQSDSGGRHRRDRRRAENARNLHPTDATSSSLSRPGRGTQPASDTSGASAAAWRVVPIRQVALGERSICNQRSLERVTKLLATGVAGRGIPTPRRRRLSRDPCVWRRARAGSPPRGLCAVGCRGVGRPGDGPRQVISQHSSNSRRRQLRLPCRWKIIVTEQGLRPLVRASPGRRRATSRR